MTRPDFQDTDGEQGFVSPATVTLANGDRVRSDSLMWLDERRKRLTAAYEKDFRARKAASEAGLDARAHLDGGG